MDSEDRIQLAIDSIKQGQFPSVRSAADGSDVSARTTSYRINGRPARRDCTPNCRKLTDTEEQVIIDFILDLNSQGFPPRIHEVAEMANLLLAERNGTPVGKNWATNFINRRPEIKSKFNRKYDYRRAKCEDPIIINEWFNLVRNTITKYGITEHDIYNFDEAGFQMGVITTAKVVTSAEARSRPNTIQPGNREWVSIIQGINSQGWPIPPFIIFAGQYHLSVWYEEGLPHNWVISLSENGWTTNKIGFDWIQHFEKHTKDRTIGKYRLLILDGHESHISLQFQKYCKDHSIITLCMPSHSSHLLQPLDVGCFSPLKTAYGHQIEKLVRLRINHITKLEFLPAFKEAFKAAFTDQNICSGFRATGLVPYNPEYVLSRLKIKAKTPTPPPIQSSNWISKTPYNQIEVDNQTALIKEQISKHQNSSPTFINTALNQLAKGAQMMAQSAILLKVEVKALQEANQIKKRREQKRKRRIMQGGSLIVRDGEDLVQNTTINDQIRQEIRSGTAQPRRCGKCKNTGHNARTCGKN
jgi:hypothetical protein